MIVCSIYFCRNSKVFFVGLLKHVKINRLYVVKTFNTFARFDLVFVIRKKRFVNMIANNRNVSCK